jgi:UDP-N-acetylmuramoyl-tripeptide--D-alanyl-D-alanine ligase
MKQTAKAIVTKLLTAETQLLLRRKRPTIIAVSGSVGKTSTKDAIYTAIKSQAKSARKSEKSFNSEIGVPLTILGLPNAWNNPFLWFRNLMDGLFTALFARDYPEVLVLETGIDRPGDMDRITKLIKPDIIVLTRLPEVPVHVEYFKTPEAVVEEKMKLVSAMSANGVLIYNRDDVIIERQLPNIVQKQVGFGRYLETDFLARKDVVVYQDDRPIGVRFVIEHSGDSHEITIKGTLGTHAVYSSAAALAVAAQLGLSLDEAATSLSSMLVAPGRMRILPGIKGSLLIDDTYNSSPVACEHALVSLGELKYVKRKIVVLGDMLELGKFSSEEHRRIGVLVAKSADILLTVGVRARGIAEGALQSGMHESHIYQYDDVLRAGRELQALLRAGDAVLVKASQGMRAERIVEEVMQEPQQAASLLVRQGLEWSRR